jgi:hypothetical protein
MASPKLQHNSWSLCFVRIICRAGLIRMFRKGGESARIQPINRGFTIRIKISMICNRQEKFVLYGRGSRCPPNSRYRNVLARLFFCCLDEKPKRVNHYSNELHLSFVFDTFLAEAHLHVFVIIVCGALHPSESSRELFPNIWFDKSFLISRVIYG